MKAVKLPRGGAVDRRKLAEMIRGSLAADVVVFGSVSGAGARKTIGVRVIDYRDAAGVWPGKAALDKIKVRGDEASMWSSDSLTGTFFSSGWNSTAMEPTYRLSGMANTPD